MDEDATAEELERSEFEGVHSVPQVLELEGAAYRFAEDADFAHRIFMLDARSKVAATSARLAPLLGWPSQEVKHDWGFHKALNEAEQAELAEGRRVLFEELVRKLERGELSAQGELLGINGLISPLTKSVVALSATRCWAAKLLCGAPCCVSHGAAAFYQRAVMLAKAVLAPPRV